MPSHRGAHPEDEEQFARSQVPVLRKAVHDLAWLRTRGYGDASSIKMVGDRYRLKRRQRDAVARSACSDDQRAHRLARRREPSSLSDDWVDIDAFNVVISVEGLLGGAYLFVGRDRAYRDVDPVQGTYRVVQETVPALEHLREGLGRVGVAGATWWLDDHVSNVGRLRARIEEVAPAKLPWEVEVSEDVDETLVDRGRVVATSDSAILDRVASWCALEQVVLEQLSELPNVRDLRPS